jgi:hypothetical protein
MEPGLSCCKNGEKMIVPMTTIEAFKKAYIDITPTGRNQFSDGHSMFAELLGMSRANAKALAYTLLFDPDIMYYK